MLGGGKQPHRRDPAPVVFRCGGRDRDHFERVTPDSGDPGVGNDAIENGPAGATDGKGQDGVACEDREHRNDCRPKALFVGFGYVDARQGAAALFERQRPAAIPQPVQQQEQAGSRPRRQDQPEYGLEQGVNELRRGAHGSV